MIGSSAAALTGLMFVVITLVTDERRGASEEGVSRFNSPTVFHYGGALFTAAFMLMPFRSLLPVAMLLGIVGFSDLVLVARITLQTNFSALSSFQRVVRTSARCGPARAARTHRVPRIVLARSRRRITVVGRYKAADGEGRSSANGALAERMPRGGARYVLFKSERRPSTCRLVAGEFGLRMPQWFVPFGNVISTKI